MTVRGGLDVFSGVGWGRKAYDGVAEGDGVMEDDGVIESSGVTNFTDDGVGETAGEARRTEMALDSMARPHPVRDTIMIMKQKNSLSIVNPPLTQ